MLTRRRVVLAGLAVPAGAVVTACGAELREPMRILVPNAPGGGYDTTARVLAGALNHDPARALTEVFNLPGAGGLAGLSRLAEERGNPALLMMMGLGVVGATQVATPSRSLSAATPLARLLGEANVLLVGARSPLRSFADLAQRWTEQPHRLRVGGGSLPGGPDYLATYAVAEALDLRAGQVDYHAFDGGGPLMTALLRDEVQVAVTGVLESIDQIRSGAVRALGVTSDQPVADEVPTLREQGLDVQFENWRGVLAPPGLSTDERDALVDVLAAGMASSVWQAAERRNGWRRRWLAGDDFGDFLMQEERRTARLLARTGEPDTAG